MVRCVEIAHAADRALVEHSRGGNITTLAKAMIACCGSDEDEAAFFRCAVDSLLQRKWGASPHHSAVLTELMNYHYREIRNALRADGDDDFTEDGYGAEMAFPNQIEDREGQGDTQDVVGDSTSHHSEALRPAELPPRDPNAPPRPFGERVHQLSELHDHLRADRKVAIEALEFEDLAMTLDEMDGVRDDQVALLVAEIENLKSIMRIGVRTPHLNETLHISNQNRSDLSHDAGSPPDTQESSVSLPPAGHGTAGTSVPGQREIGDAHKSEALTYAESWFTQSSPAMATLSAAAICFAHNVVATSTALNRTRFDPLAMLFDTFDLGFSYALGQAIGATAVVAAGAFLLSLVTASFRRPIRESLPKHYSRTVVVVSCLILIASILLFIQNALKSKGTAATLSDARMQAVLLRPDVGDSSTLGPGSFDDATGPEQGPDRGGVVVAHFIGLAGFHQTGQSLIAPFLRLGLCQGIDPSKVSRMVAYRRPMMLLRAARACLVGRPESQLRPPPDPSEKWHVARPPSCGKRVGLVLQSCMAVGFTPRNADAALQGRGDG